MFKWSVRLPSHPRQAVDSARPTERAKVLTSTLPSAPRGLVAAGLKDLSRPAEVISIPQNLGQRPRHCLRFPSIPQVLIPALVPDLAALTATGLIWVRYSFVITPVNYSLAAVNAFVGATGIASLYRAWE